MGVVWENKIASFDREIRGVKLAKFSSKIKKMEVKERRGLPERFIPSDVLFDYLAGKISREQKERLVRSYRLLARSRAAKEKARKRFRPDGGNINLWRRRQEWLKQVQEEF